LAESLGRSNSFTRDAEDGRTLNDDAKIVFSKTLKNPTWKNTQVIPDLDRNDPEDETGKGERYACLGSGSIVSQLTQHAGRRIYAGRQPRLLGKGRPLFDGVTIKTSLELKEAKGYRSGNVLLRYTRT